jgi:hypothetical protein
MPVILATWGTEAKRPQSKATLVKVSKTPSQKKKKGLGVGVWLKWSSTCLACTTHQKKIQKIYFYNNTSSGSTLTYLFK